MVVKSQDLVCLEWASRKSEWENLAILRTSVATAFAANLAAKDYYRIYFDHSDEEVSSCEGLNQHHIHEAMTLEMADFVNNNVLEGTETMYSGTAGDLIVL